MKEAVKMNKTMKKKGAMMKETMKNKETIRIETYEKASYEKDGKQWKPMRRQAMETMSMQAMETYE